MVHNDVSTSQFGSNTPFAEPAWYNSLNSPYYNESHKRLRKFLRDYMEENVNPYIAEWEEAGEVPAHVFKQHAEIGLTGLGLKPHLDRYAHLLKFPAGIKREEWDIFHDLIVSDEYSGSGYLGWGFAMNGGNSIGAPPVLRFGSDELKDHIIPSLIRGEKRICLGITEPDAGSDVAQIKTTAKLSADGKYYVVNGSKKWITNGVYSDWCTAAVRTGGPGHAGLSALVIPTDLPGVSRRLIKNSGVNCSGSTFFTFEDVKVPVFYRLGQEGNGFAYIMSNFNRERWGMAAGALRMARLALKDAYEYACIRKTFGKPLIQQPLISNKFAIVGRQIEATQAWLEQITYHMHTCRAEDVDRDTAGSIALLKTQATTCLEIAVREAQQVFGGASFAKSGKGARVEDMNRNVRVMVVGGGSEEILTLLSMRQATANALRKEKALAKL